jgi:hypothetical protein
MTNLNIGQPEILRKWKIFDEGFKTAPAEGAFEWKFNTWYSFPKLEGPSVKGFSAFDGIPEAIFSREEHWAVLAHVECFNEYSDGSGKRFYESMRIYRAWHWGPEDFRTFAVRSANILLRNLKDPKELLALGAFIKLNEAVSAGNAILEKKNHFLKESRRLESSAVVVEDLSLVYRKYWDAANELRKTTPEMIKLTSLVWQRILQILSGRREAEAELRASADRFHELLPKYRFASQ